MIDIKLHPINLIIRNERTAHLGHSHDIYGPFYVWDMLEGYYSDLDKYVKEEGCSINDD